ncbi:MAG: acyl-CoA/acyl-ACP dehydrogenase [Myxococcales bacterium]|nr:acyl-CoA/acyl-ACP dehydrogenase [Myxococcales bacterium]
MTIDLGALAPALAARFAERAARHDAEGSFARENSELLRRERIYSALVPSELGGGGASLAEMSALLRVIAASCASTALTLSMHQHLVAAAVYKLVHHGESRPLLERLAREQLVLVSTGASDWVDANGTMTKVDGGYRVSARKIFSSGCEVADMMITSARYDDPQHGPQVLHFPLSYENEGVRLLDDWDTLGMRASGSHTVLLEDAFVPEEAIALRRPRGRWHAAWTVALVSAAPLYMSPYVGVAEQAQREAHAAARHKASEPYMPFLVGELDSAVATAQLALSALVQNHADYNFDTSVQTAARALTYKTICSNACLAALRKAVEICGGRAFFRGQALERMVRDIQAAPFHPLPEKKQQLFCGRLAMGLDPVSGLPL